MAPAKLYFFDARGRAEVIKLIMEAGKMPYENVYFTWDEWPEYKKNMPYGKCPVLEVEGKRIGQTIAISLYVAEKCGLQGSTIDERLVVNQALLLREEMMVEEVVPWREAHPLLKKEKRRILCEEKFPQYLVYLTEMIKENSKGKAFVLGDKLSAADCCIYAATTTLEQERPDILAQFPLVTALRKRVAEVDGIKQFLAKRNGKPTYDI